MSYNDTRRVSYVGYVVQAIVNCLYPLLYVTFNREFSIPFTEITVLITVNFVIQLAVDILSARYVDKIGIRNCLVGAHILAGTGLLLFAFLPYVMPPLAGMLIGTAFTATGGGLIEVIVSPIIEACPSDNKAGSMSLLHSFYCWGQMAVVLVTTLLLILGVRWSIVTALWAAVPLVNAIFCAKIPIAKLVEDGEGMSIKELFSQKIFPVLIVLLLCSGAAEQVMSQWSSAFAESGLGVSKAVGDILGPCLFACLMGIARVIYGKLGKKINLLRFMIICGIVCTLSFAVAAFAKLPALRLAGCAVSGFGVGVMWPGFYSLAAERLPKGGNPMFSFLALAGDMGCTVGPTFTGEISGLFGNDLGIGIAFSIIFPLALTVFAVIFGKMKNA